MPLDLKEAEVAAYLDPSQENLAVYVRSLEEALEDAASTIKVLEEQLTEMRMAASL